MGDIKLFRINNDQVTQTEGKAVGVEKSLQQLIEKHLPSFLGVRFLASEYGTGKAHGGRIDTMGIDENNCPVIIEYKRAINENVVSQGLYYLDWLLDHKGEFILLVLKKYGQKIADNIEWAGARLICIASNFTKYDEHSIKQINRNIELIRYRRYGDDLLLFDLVSASTGDLEVDVEGRVAEKSPSRERSVEDRLQKAPIELRDRYEALKAFLIALGDDVQVNAVKNYFAFKRLRNFACVDIHPQTQQLVVWLNLDPAQVDMIEGFSRDVTKIGHHGTGNVEIILSNTADFERAQPTLVKSYEMS
jgi:predicted transport protein